MNEVDAEAETTGAAPHVIVNVIGTLVAATGVAVITCTPATAEVTAKETVFVSANAVPVLTAAPLCHAKPAETLVALLYVRVPLDADRGVAIPYMLPTPVDAIR